MPLVYIDNLCWSVNSSLVSLTFSQLTLLFRIYSLLFFVYAACPILGQIRSECASLSSCHLTCDNRNTTQICPLVCVINGCECPAGTVIDEDKNECVDPTECPGT